MATIQKFLSPRFYAERLYRSFFLTFVYNEGHILAEEENKLNELGGDRDLALRRINAIFQKKYGRDFQFSSDSIHSFLWAVLSTSNQTIKRILEIGTSEGEGTSVLAELFPNAQIVTVDLPEEDPHLRAFYGRDTDELYKKYIEKQKNNLRYPNIKPITVNSFFLPSNEKEAFDLIWVDGGHLYPEVAWDICNAWNICAPGGVIMCDDVIPTKRLHKTAYASSESHEVLRYIALRANIHVILFLKRRAPYLYPFLVTRKYVALFKKPH